LMHPLDGQLGPPIRASAFGSDMTDMVQSALLAPACLPAARLFRGRRVLRSLRSR
jgi:hypothetical protein